MPHEIFQFTSPYVSMHTTSWSYES